ncbi:probable RNA-binding protein EIF1AD [Bufo gargarizans]|uniref:probable RNA-binding protein EIF1AD n=1 Tax=Bufo gargarizans TaxID=30331 RepID=UPI001CF21E9D|nr:probable RNA-binding protein EIF1AD [Bufo gargarizans]XP_044126198.1 probable RNA-binding protein EIF1AD [Bufo gargarizans]
MSKATKRKHVVKEVLLDYVQPSENQRIVRVLGSPGNNLHEVETADGERFLASMPTKFRKNIWIKRGDFVIVDPIAEGEKVKAEITFIIYKDHQRLLQKEGLWPLGFNKDGAENPELEKESNKGAESQNSKCDKSGSEDDDSEDDSDLFVNTNRVYYEDSEEESESEEEEEEKE